MHWIRTHAPLLALLAITALFVPAALAQEPETPATDAGESASSAFVDDFLAELDRVRDQVRALAAVVPQKTYTWRPAEGVRSVGEAYLHIAFGNYLLLSVAGYPVPADLEPRLGVDKIQAWDTATTDKEAIAERVSRSFDHVRSTVAAIPAADLEETVEFFGQTPTRRQMLLLILGHVHEHLGQSIAYARMNGVVPPWSAAQQEAQREAAEAAGGS